MTRRALDLAALGIGQVSPGPLVGCVIVDKKGEIVGEGSYFYDNITHAEVEALNAAGAAAKGGTAYISLEPHSHHGKTPPCTEALLRAGISRVVVPIEDPNPLVSGKGFSLLKESGIEVSSGILFDEASRQNEKFLHWHKNDRPFVHIKMAASLDGKSATRTGDSKWITNEASRAAGQQLRHEYDAILVGRGTVETDDPRLTDRSGKKRRRPLIRVVLDSNLKTDLNAKVISTAGEVPTIVFCAASTDKEKVENLRKQGADIVELERGPSDLGAVLNELAAREIQSVLVEGGPTVAGCFFQSGLVDKVSCFLAPLIIGGENAIPSVGGPGAEYLKDALKLKDLECRQHEDDFEFTGYPVELRKEV